MHQHEVTSAQEARSEDAIAVQGLVDNRKRAVDEATLLVQVARQANYETRSRQYAQRRLRRRVAGPAVLQVLVGDAFQLQGGLAHCM